MVKKSLTKRLEEENYLGLIVFYNRNMGVNLYNYNRTNTEIFKKRQKSLVDLSIPKDAISKDKLFDLGIINDTPLIAYYDLKQKKIVELLDPLSQEVLWKAE